MYSSTSSAADSRSYAQVSSPLSIHANAPDDSDQAPLSVAAGLSAPVRESRRSCCPGATTRHLKGIKGMLFCAAAGIGFRDLLSKGTGELVALGTKAVLAEEVNLVVSHQAQGNETIGIDSQNSTEIESGAGRLAALATATGASFTVLGGPAAWHASNLVAHATGASETQTNVLRAFGVTFGYVLPLAVPAVHAVQASRQVAETAEAAVVPGVAAAADPAAELATDLATGWNAPLSVLAGRLQRDSFNALMRGVFNGVKPIDPVTGKSLNGKQLARYDAIRLSGATVFYAGVIFTHFLSTRDALSDAAGPDAGTRTSAVLAEGADGFLGVIACIIASCAVGCKLGHDDNDCRALLENLGIFHKKWTQKAKDQLAGASPEKIRQTCRDNRKNTSKQTVGNYAVRELFGKGVDLCVNEAARAEADSVERFHWLVAASLLAAFTELRGWFAQNGMAPAQALMAKLPGLPASGSAVAPPAMDDADDDLPEVELLSPAKRRSSAAPQPVDEEAVQALKSTFWQEEAAKCSGYRSGGSSSMTMRSRPLSPSSERKVPMSPSSSLHEAQPLPDLDTLPRRTIFTSGALSTT